MDLIDRSKLEEVVPIRFAHVSYGAVFKWLVPRDCGDAFCLKVRVLDGGRIGWMPLTGNNVGTIYNATDQDEVGAIYKEKRS